VRLIAEGLRLGHTAAAPVIILRAKQRVFYLVGANLRLRWERLLTHVPLEAALEVIATELLNRDTLISCQVWVQEALFQVLIALFSSQSARLIRAVEVASLLGSLHVANLFLKSDAGRNFRPLLILVG